MSNKKSPCDGCKNKPAPGGNYGEMCGECSRFYWDNFEREITEHRHSAMLLELEILMVISDPSPPILVAIEQLGESIAEYEAATVDMGDPE